MTYDIRNGKQKTGPGFLFNNSMRFVWLAHWRYGDFGSMSQWFKLHAKSLVDGELPQSTLGKVFCVLSIHCKCRISAQQQKPTGLHFLLVSTVFLHILTPFFGPFFFWLFFEVMLFIK